jgi:two-component system, NarL family, response regulator
VPGCATIAILKRYGLQLIAAGERDSQTMPENRSKIRIVVVDDHPVVRDGLASMIETQEDMELVGEGGTGQEAITLFHQLKPDVMLLDLKLPDIDGVQVIETLRATIPEARIVVLTTYVGDVQARRALRAGLLVIS